MEYIIDFLVGSVATAGIMFLACKLTDVVIEFKWLAVSVVISSLVSLIPGLGWLLSIAVLFWLLDQFSNVRVWPDLVFMVVISRLLTVFLILPFIGA